MALVGAGAVALWWFADPRTVTTRPIQWVSEVDAMELTVVDAQGLVRAARAGTADDILIDGTAITNPGGDERLLAVQWASLPCEIQPRITLSIDSGFVRLMIARHIGDDVSCESMSLERNVVLELTRDVPASRVLIQEAG